MGWRMGTGRLGALLPVKRIGTQNRIINIEPGNNYLVLSKNPYSRTDSTKIDTGGWQLNL